jgi:hypothetical protein
MTTPEIPHSEKPEKTEKEEEKEEEKRHEKEDRTFDEKFRRDPVAATGWALVLIWAGLVLLAENLGYLARLAPFGTWDIIFIGAGIIVLLGAAIRYLVPAYRRPVGGSVIIGIILLAIGLGDTVGTGVIWAAALILIGLFILLRAAAKR